MPNFVYSCVNTIGADANPRKPEKLNSDDAVPLVSGVSSTARELRETCVSRLKLPSVDNKIRYSQYEFEKVNRNIGNNIIKYPKIMFFLLPNLSTSIPPRNEDTIPMPPTIEKIIPISPLSSKSGGSEKTSEIKGITP